MESVHLAPPPVFVIDDQYMKQVVVCRLDSLQQLRRADLVSISSILTLYGTEVMSKSLNVAVVGATGKTGSAIIAGLLGSTETSFVRAAW